MDFFFKRYNKRENPVQPAQSAAQPDKGGSYSARVDYVRGADAALTISAVYRATELRANTLAQMPAYVQKKMQGGNFATWMSGRGKALNYLLTECPNPLMDASSFFAQLAISRLMRGNGIAYIERDVFGEPRHMWLANGVAYNEENGTYSLSYLSDRGIVVKPSVPREDVLHFANSFRTYGGFWGISTLRYATDTLTVLKTQRKHILESAAKGGRVKLLLSEDRNGGQSLFAQGMFAKEAGKAYAREISNDIYSQDVVSLRGLDKVNNISMSSADQQLLEQQLLEMDDVARFWGVPRPLLMLDTNSHYNDYASATMEFLSRTISADLRCFSAELQRKLIGADGFGKYRIDFDQTTLMMLDDERRAKIDLLNLQTGAKSVNEIRLGHNSPPVQGGDEVFVSTNLNQINTDESDSQNS